MIKADDLVSAFWLAINQDWGYIWGTAGVLWTQTKQNSATRPTTVQYGSQWIGHYVSDCSGMFVWAYKKFGCKIYHGSNTIWKKYCSKQGKLVNGSRADGYELKPGTAVFLLNDTGRHHIGLYVGDGQCIEAKGTKYGVVTSPITHWDEWGELKEVDYSAYDEKRVDTMNPTLRKGDAGEDVKRLQELLNGYGYKLDPDGKFGPATEGAVKAFQQGHSLKADGIVGPATWAALKPVSTETVAVSMDTIKRMIDQTQTLLAELKSLGVGAYE